MANRVPSDLKSRDINAVWQRVYRATGDVGAELTRQAGQITVTMRCDV